MPSSNEATVAVVVKVVRKYADVPGGMLPLLHEIQANVGFIPKDCVVHIASGMGLSRAEVHGVISFYHDFHDQPRGEKTIHLCRAEACYCIFFFEFSTFGVRVCFLNFRAHHFLKKDKK